MKSKGHYLLLQRKKHSAHASSLYCYLPKPCHESNEKYRAIFQVVIMGVRKNLRRGMVILFLYIGNFIPLLWTG
jgi:hypothetical protein